MTVMEFLAEKEALEKFLDNIDKQASEEGFKLRIEMLKRNELDIDGGFSWAIAPEGTDYWYKLSAEYYDKYGRLSK